MSSSSRPVVHEDAVTAEGLAYRVVRPATDAEIAAASVAGVVALADEALARHHAGDPEAFRRLLRLASA